MQPFVMPLRDTFARSNCRHFQFSTFNLNKLERNANQIENAHPSSAPCRAEPSLSSFQPVGVWLGAENNHKTYCGNSLSDIFAVFLLKKHKFIYLTRNEFRSKRMPWEARVGCSKQYQPTVNRSKRTTKEKGNCQRMSSQEVANSETASDERKPREVHRL